MSRYNKNITVNRPTVSSATRASITDENKRKEKAKESASSLTRSKQIVSSRDADRTVDSKPPIQSSSNTRNKEKTIYTAHVSAQLQIKKEDDSHKEMLDNKNRFAKSVSTADWKSQSNQISRERCNENDDESRLRTDSFIRSLSHNDAERKKQNIQDFSQSHCALNRSLSNEETSRSLQKQSGRFAASRRDYEAGGHVGSAAHVDSYTLYDTPKSTQQASGQHTLASRKEPELLRDNLNFYLGKIKSKPAPGHTIEEMLKWKGDYRTLEGNHLYIQWLFPITEGRGLNQHAQPLMEYEAEGIKRDDKASKRVVKAYKMMLDFYGMKLIDEVVGTVGRNEKIYEERYEHLNRSRHNLLRITRIIKCLGALGYDRYQAQWVNFLFNECITNKALPNINTSCFHHWIDAINDEGERETMYRKLHGLPVDIDIGLNDVNSENNEGEGADGINKGGAKDRTEIDGGRTQVHKGETEVPVESAIGIGNATRGASPGVNQWYESDNDVLRTNGTTKEKPSGGEIKTTRPITMTSFDSQEQKARTGEQEAIKGNDSVELRASESTNAAKQRVPASDNSVKQRDISPVNPEEIRYDSSSCVAGPKPLTKVENRRLRQHDDYNTCTSRPSMKYDGVNDVDVYNPSTDEDDTENDIKLAELTRQRLKIPENMPCDNLKFYMNEILSRPPPGYTIETFLMHAGDYFFFDNYPYFIQWLFPTPSGSPMNEEAQPLYSHEVKGIMDDGKAYERVFRAYVLILDYYGMEIEDRNLGTIKRKSNFKERWKDLNGSENMEFRRITRILTFLGEVGYDRYQVPLINFFIAKGIQSDKYIKGLTWDHISFWINCIKDEGEKQAMYAEYQTKLFNSSDSVKHRSDHHSGYTEIPDPHWPSATQYMY